MDEDEGRGTCRYPGREEPWKCLFLSLPKLYRTREVLYVQEGGGTVSHRVPPPFPLFPGVKESLPPSSSPSPHIASCSILRSCTPPPFPPSSPRRRRRPLRPSYSTGRHLRIHSRGGERGGKPTRRWVRGAGEGEREAITYSIYVRTVQALSPRRRERGQKATHAQSPTAPSCAFGDQRAIPGQV